MALERAGKLLNGRASDGRFPTLSLDIDALESQAVLLDDPIDAAVTGTAHYLGGIFVGTAVSHSDQQFDN